MWPISGMKELAQMMKILTRPTSWCFMHHQLKNLLLTSKLLSPTICEFACSNIFCIVTCNVNVLLSFERVVQTTAWLH